MIKLHFRHELTLQSIKSGRQFSVLSAKQLPYGSLIIPAYGFYTLLVHHDFYPIFV